MTAYRSLLLATFLLTAAFLRAQHQLSIQVGAGNYTTPESYVSDETSENGDVDSWGTSSLFGFINGTAVQLAYKFGIKPRIRFGGQFSYLHAREIMDANAEYVRSVNGSPPTRISLASPRKLQAFRFDGMVFFDLLSADHKINLLLGSGASMAYRTQHYRSFYRLDFNNQNQGVFAEEQYTDERKLSAGIPLELQIGIPLSAAWQLTLTSSSGFYRDQEVFLQWLFGLAYRW